MAEKLKYKVNIQTLKSAKRMFSKASIELVFDDYEIHAVDCLDGGAEYSANSLDSKAITRLYKKLLSIYSSRIDETSLKASTHKDDWEHIQL